MGELENEARYLTFVLVQLTPTLWMNYIATHFHTYMNPLPSQSTPTKHCVTMVMRSRLRQIQVFQWLRNRMGIARTSCTLAQPVIYSMFRYHHQISTHPNTFSKGMLEILSKDREALPRYDHVLALANIEHHVIRHEPCPYVINVFLKE